MSLLTQMLLDLAPEAPQTISNYVVGANSETIQHLRELPYSKGFQALYLWGDSGCGKTHLLHACANVHRPSRAIFASDGSTIALPESVEAGSLIVVDDVQSLSDAGQNALFRLFNNARHAGLAFALAGPCAPMALSLREDLRTRIGQSLIFHLQPLSEDEKRTALHRHAAQRGMRLDDTIINYLMYHGRRDLPSLMRTLDRLDQLSLEQRKQPTLPLLRTLMQPTLDLDTHEPRSL